MVFFIIIIIIFSILWRMGKNKAYVPTLTRIRYMSCFNLTGAPVATAARAAATGRVSMSTRPDPERSGAVEIDRLYNYEVGGVLFLHVYFQVYTIPLVLYRIPGIPTSSVVVHINVAVRGFFSAVLRVAEKRFTAAVIMDSMVQLLRKEKGGKKRGKARAGRVDG